VIIGIIEAAVCRSSDIQAHQTMVFSAVAHGATRRSQKLPPEAIAEEYTALHHILSPFLERKYDEAAREFRPALRHAIDEAASGCRYGFTHTTSSTSWDEYVERLAQQSLEETRERIGERVKSR
jgi:hypothetical protein